MPTSACNKNSISSQPTGRAVTARSPSNPSAVTFSMALIFWSAATDTYALSLHDALPILCSSEPLTINPNQPSISTLLSESTGGIGDSVHDTSSLSGATSNAGGTVSYAVYTNNTCKIGRASCRERREMPKGGAATAGAAANASGGS